MHQTRIDSKKLAADVLKASDLLDQAMRIMNPHLPVLSDEERLVTARARTGFFDHLPALVAAAAGHPEVVKASGFDAAAVTEDATNVATIAPLAVKASELAQLIADAELTWSGEAFASASTLYRVAKSLATSLPGVRTIVDAFAPLFVVGAKAKKVA